jgi:hypothetical protein
MQREDCAVCSAVPEISAFQIGPFAMRYANWHTQNWARLFDNGVDLATLYC